MPKVSDLPAFSGTLSRTDKKYMLIEAGTGNPTIVPIADTMPRTLAPTARVLVGNTHFPVPDNLIDDTTSNSLNSRKLCFAPASSDITDIVLGFPGFGFIVPETDFPVSYTVKASVEYPLASTPQQVFFSGATSVTVAPGRRVERSDPLPIHIPAGAQFAVKCYVTWSVGHFWLTTWTASRMVGEWTTRGTGVSDNTLNTTTLSTTSGLAGFGPIVYAAVRTPTPIVAIIGDSIGTATGDYVDTVVGHNGWGRAMRNEIPFINLCRSGDSYLAGYVLRPEGRNLILRDAFTHLIWEIGANDLYGGASAATLEANLQAGINPFLSRGIQCYAVTLTPRTTSTDNWITTANQTVTSAPVEAVRQTYNTWLRTNYASIGLSGYFDLAHAVDPSDTGKWGCDAGYTCLSAASGAATLSGGAITSVGFFTYNGNSSVGSFTAGGAAQPCVVYPFPGLPGSGATITCTPHSVNAWFASFTVSAGGSLYDYPPMIATKGSWTNDGVHPTTRGVAEIIYQCGGSIGGSMIAPETFVLWP